MGKYLKLAWRNVWRNWRRTAIALVAIVLGLMLLLLLDGLIKGSDQAIFGNAVRLYGGNMQVHAPGFRDKLARLPLLPLADVDAVVDVVRAQPQVVAAAKRINTGGLISSREGAFPVSITAIEPAIEAPVSIQAENIAVGRFLQPDDSDAIVIGQGLADLLEVTAGDRVILVGRRKNETMRQRTMTVVGVYDLNMPDAEKGTVFMTLPEAQSLYNLRGQATEIPILLQNVGQADVVLPTLRAALPAYEVDTWETLRPEIRQTLDTKALVSGIFGLIVVLIASIGILNLLLMAVFERTREMGVLAALGMKRGQIITLFLLEGSLIGFVGAVVGCLLGGVVVWLLGQVGIPFAVEGMGEATALMGSRLYPALTIADLLRHGITVTVVAAVASLYPAWQAVRKEPAEALHYV
ncbi:MAG: FtsX-like permease family protein [Caldilineaceae bacterium]